MIKKLHILLFVLVSAFLVVTPQSVFATTDFDAIFKNRPYYDDATCAPSSGGANYNAGGLNQTYNGREIWSATDLDTINANKSVYEQAAEDAGGMTWQLVAALHKIESGLSRSNPPNGQGLFQDAAGVNGPYPTGPVDEAEFLRQAKWGANFFKTAKSENFDHPSNNKNLSTPEGVKFGLMAFNGLSSGQWADQAEMLGFDPVTEMYEGSSYVMNYADEQRNPEVNQDWGGYHGDGVFAKPAPHNIGTWLMYNALLGLTGGATFNTTGGDCDSSDTATGPLANRIVEIASREFDTYKDVSSMEATDEYIKYTDGNRYAWCAAFVSWVMREAGSPFTEGAADEGWLQGGVINMKSWFEEYGGYHDAASGYVPKPGDVVFYIYSGNTMYPEEHVNLVVAVDDDTITTIGGNETDTIRKFEHARNMPVTGYGTKQ